MLLESPGSLTNLHIPIGFGDYVKAFEGASGSTLESFMVRPVQRLYKYPLFFNDIFKHTSEEFSGFPLITKVLDSMSACAGTWINHIL